jgi:hypothetical protein
MFTICPAAQYDSSLLHDPRQNMTAVYCMSNSNIWQQFTKCRAAQNDISLQYDKQHNMAAVYKMTSSTEL